MRELWLGLDSTDSVRGGCTTHVVALLAELVVRLGGTLLEHPCLVRLNPNIPFKTRGNGATSLHFKMDESTLPNFIRCAEASVTEEADLAHDNADPGLVIIETPIAMDLRQFAARCLHEVVTLSEAFKLAERHKIYYHVWKTGRGLVGALAAASLKLPPDYIFELIAYRTKDNVGKTRQIDPHSVFAMDESTSPFTLNNADPETGRILITPRGPDPVLLGIRGESAEAVLEAFTMLDIHEEIERWIIFQSNECTDSHVKRAASISELSPNVAAAIQGVVCGRPWVARGGHVFVTLADNTGEITLAAYEPTGSFRNVVEGLLTGDEVIAVGGVKSHTDGNGLLLNLESLTTVNLRQEMEANPRCPSCGRGMESMGSRKGHRCRRCGLRISNSTKLPSPVPRELEQGRQYMPPPRAHRHLTQPLTRLQLREKSSPALLNSDWSSFTAQR